MTEPEALGRVFKQLRGKTSQELIGFELGFTQRKVSDLERKGIHQISDLVTIAEFYEMKVSELAKRAEKIAEEMEGE
ncbi:MAG: hypothetical protein J6N15_03435 [Ruminiclostridium sp.]|nr:hypothetical protein [Ruminiclostridium sp.]